jgi:histidinol-phosphatase (PHP family)
MPIQCDYHMHTPLCKHAAGPMEAYIERGIELGLKEIGFSDHNPLPRGLSANVRMAEAELDYYVGEVLRLREEYFGQIEVKLGLEMDYLEGLEPYLAKQIEKYPWDYVIGSVHFLDPECRTGSWPKNYRGNVRELFARYFELVRKLAGSGLYDIVGHLDVVKRSGHLPNDPADAEQITRTLEEIARTGMCIEINTSGFRHTDVPQPESYPSFPVVEQALALEIPLTVNSDAHAPEQVGLEFPRVEEFLRSKGCRSLVRFDRRSRVAYPF